jgi:hypothetical protein
MSKVYIINKSSHDYTKATKYGELIFITEGLINAYNLNQTFRRAYTTLQEFDAKEDYILLTGLASTNLIIGWVLGWLQKDINVLLYKEGDYIVRRLTFDHFREKEKQP